jgi:glycosyltransferase involved in cell wall biosynthesis
MRIGINTRFLLKGRLEGLGVYTEEVSSRLVKLFPEHEWVFFFDRKFDESFIFNENVQGVAIFPPARHPFLWYSWFEFSLPRHIRKQNIDLLFSPDGYCSLSTEVPQLLTIHDIAFEFYPQGIPKLVNQYYRYFTPLYCRKAEHILCVSEQTQEDIIRMYGINQEKTSVVHNGCSDDFRSFNEFEKQRIRLSLSNGQPFFVYVGAIHPRKNVLGILKAFELLKASDSSLPHKLLLVGRQAWDNAAFDQFLSTMTYRNDVILVDHISRDKIPGIIASAEAMVYPSYYEGFGLPVLEAMACGVPSVTSGQSPMESFAGDSCMAVQPDDIQGMKDAMHRLATNEAWRTKLGNSALEKAQILTWDNAAGKIAVQIEKLLAIQKKK